MSSREFKQAVRTATFEIHSVAGEWKSATKRWFALADQCKQIVNCIWQTWLVWHVQNGSADKLRAWLNKRASDGVKAAGKCPVEPMPKALQKQMQDEIPKRFANTNSRVVSLVMNTTIRDLKTHKAAKGALPGHSAILLCHQSLPSSTRSQPIPFDRSNANLLPPAEPGGNWNFEMRLWRLPDPAKQKSPSVLDTIELRCQGRRVQSQVAILKRIAAGDYKFCGSELAYYDKKRKWFIHLCYQMPVKRNMHLDPGRIASLLPHSKRPWELVLPGVPKKKRPWPGGHGDYVAGFRRRIFLQRRSRSREYRNANTNRKGHGSKRAMAWRWKLQARWNDFVKRVNHIVTTEVVRRCVDEGVGTLVYFQPEGGFSESRFLSLAGKDERWNDATTWQWFQVKSMLQYKCEAAGIELLVEPVGREGPERQGVAKSPVKAT